MKPKNLWFKISICTGALLGLLLFVQTVRTYQYVSDNLVRLEAGREADRRINSISRALRLTGSDQASTLTPVLQELVKEAPTHIAWIRIFNLDGKEIAESAKVPGAPVYKPGDLDKLLSNRSRRPEERDLVGGRVLITMAPMRGGPIGGRGGGRGRGPQDTAQPQPTADPQPPVEAFLPPPDAQPPDMGRAGGPPPSDGRRGGGIGRGGRGGRQLEIVEIGVYLNGVSTNFGPLQENLILGCSAAFALLGAVVLIGLRFRHYMRSKHMEEELSIARRVQLDLFPDQGSMVGNLAFAAKCVPAYHVGGDIYDVYRTDDGGVALLLGDVSGKGLPAALLMGVVQGAVRASSLSGPDQLEQAAERLNHLLCMKTARERFVSLFWGVFDSETSQLMYINAGHLPPLLIRKSGAVSEAQEPPDAAPRARGTTRSAASGGVTCASSSEVIRLSDGGPVLGLLPGMRYTVAIVAVEPGDILVVFSDGISEAANAADEEFGEERIIGSVERMPGRDPIELCGGILEDVRAFIGSEPPRDDQTLMVVRLEPAVRESWELGQNVESAVAE